MSMSNCPEGYIRCPYEVSHIILKSRFQMHLVKCKQVHEDSPLVACPFNNTHKVPAIELNCHKMYLCPDRKKLDLFVCATNKNETEPLFPVEPLEIAAPESENWDDVQHPTYDPSEHCKKEPVLMNLQGATPSQRKGFRAEQRQRYQQYSAAFQTQESTRAETSVRLPQTLGVTHNENTNESTQGTNRNGSDNSSNRDFEDDESFAVPTSCRGRGRGRVRGSFAP